MPTVGPFDLSVLRHQLLGVGRISKLYHTQPQLRLLTDTRNGEESMRLLVGAFVSLRPLLPGDVIAGGFCPTYFPLSRSVATVQACFGSV